MDARKKGQTTTFINKGLGEGKQKNKEEAKRKKGNKIK